MIISFIIPVYNTGCYLERCVNSIFNQDMEKGSFEVIIINDGSTDNSAQVIDTLVKDRDSIQSIHTENRGLGAARNTGINMAQGKYLFFVDSDDYLFDHSLSSLLHYAESATADIIGLDWARVSPNRSIVKKKREIAAYDSPMSGAEYLTRYNLSGGACPYLFSAFLLKDTPILMPEGIYHEDELFLSEVFTYAHEVMFINQLVYAYYQREDSITNDNCLIYRRLDDILYILNQHAYLITRAGLTNLQKDGLDRRTTFLTVDFIINLIRYKCDNVLLVKYLNNIANHKLYPLPPKPYSLKYKLFRVIFNHRQNIVLASKLGLFKVNT